MRNYLLYFFVLTVWTALLPFSPSVPVISETLEQNECTSSDIISVLTDDGIIEVSLDEYVLGVMLNEMPANYEKQALLAQAVCIRSYVLYILENKPRTPEHPEADFCNNPSCCRSFTSYKELLELISEENATARFLAMSAAVYETSGQILTYDGKPIMALYHISSPARTESYGNVFDISVPYLTGVTNVDESGFVRYKQDVRFSFDELEALLMANGYDYSYTEEEFFSVLTNENMRCEYVILGETEIPGRAFSEIAELKSSCYEIKKDVDGYIITSYGYGSGLGMSQYGANILASEGRTYEEILKFYFKDTNIQKLK